MEHEKHHIQSYTQLALILIALLFLTFITILVAGFHFGAFSIGIALLVASIKCTIVLLYFMHLKSESLFMKLTVAGVFLLFAAVVVITFFDYLLR